jgi:hypothetical protein
MEWGRRQDALLDTTAVDAVRAPVRLRVSRVRVKHSALHAVSKLRQRHIWE